MNLPDQIKNKLSRMSLLEKIAAILLLPITLIGLILKIKGVLEEMLESAKGKTDKESER